MRKPGTDENNVQMSDVLCDFCRAEWTETLPIIEGHQGSIICGRCLAVACAEVLVAGGGSTPAGYTCTMCLEKREDRAWVSPAYPEAAICARCIDLAATALAKDKDWNWKRPG